MLGHFFNLQPSAFNIQHFHHMVTVLCVTFYFKGHDFLKAAKANGCRVFLLTHESHRHKAWPWEAIDEIFTMPDDRNDASNTENMVKGLAWLMREKQVDMIVALDDFDVEKAAAFREEFRIPGMGQTTARYFRDKLAMRMRAADAGIPVPAFTALFHNDAIHRFADTIPTPWLLKPRSEASAMGIKKIHSKDELWQQVNELGDRRHAFLVEQFRPGDVYHVDALTYGSEVRFHSVAKYMATPFDVMHGAGIFRTMTCDPGTPEHEALTRLNADVMKAFGMRHSASHTEFIRCHDDGSFVFLETSSRVGGAHINELVEISTGINLWSEWAHIELAAYHKQVYKVPKATYTPAGLIISLSRFEKPDTTPFNDPEIAWRMDEPSHIGFILKTKDRERLLSRMDGYAERIRQDYHGSAPVPDKPSH
jgi:biotin carboxylase